MERFGGVAILACLLLLLLCFFLPLQSSAQISPGPLSKAHRALGGPAGCTQCHAVSTRSPEFHCLDCHREIAARLAQHRGLHPALVEMYPGSPGKACVRCHSEHNGEDFSLVHWDPKTFHHSTTGYTLEGKHAEVACNRCHSPERVAPAERSAIKNVNRTYLGLSRTCTSCHEDKHRGQLGANCLQCHTMLDWKARFDHSRTRYPLTGAHLQVGCQKCHMPSADGTPRYTGLKFDRCAACHNDPHRAAFAQQSCESCHNTASWKQTAVAGRFDHAQTKFPLLGKHAQVGCASCHRGDDFKAPVAHDACSSCHSDPHNGQFAKRADGGRCESCHTVDGWKPANFALAEHARTGFPLRGGHATTPCAKCHLPAGRATLFKVKFALCTECHQDEHRGQFARAPFLNRCEQCHDETAYHPSTFTLARHQQSSFPLTGGHKAVACLDCHKPLAGSKVARYHLDSVTCASCHADPHHAQFAERMRKTDAHGTPLGCEACHSTATWKDLARFDHGTTSFALSGTHRAVGCGDCHRPPNLERTLLNVDFHAAPAQCEECHEDPHGAQFARAGATRCADCHTTTKWRPSLFDHEKTAFSLKGAHEDVRCKACHADLRPVDGAQVLFYKPTPTKCDVCHGNAPVAKGT